MIGVLPGNKTGGKVVVVLQLIRPIRFHLIADVSRMYYSSSDSRRHCADSIKNAAVAARLFSSINYFA